METKQTQTVIIQHRRVVDYELEVKVDSDLLTQVDSGLITLEEVFTGVRGGLTNRKPKPLDSKLGKIYEDIITGQKQGVEIAEDNQILSFDLTTL